MDTIDVFDFARRASSVQGEIALADLPRLAAGLLRRDARLSYRAVGLIDERGRPALALHMQAVLPLRCDRCGQELDLPLHADKQFFFVHTEAELAAIPIDDTPEEALMGSTRFDLRALIEDEAILHLPISPRHENCVAARQPAAPSSQQDQDRRPFAQLAALRERLGESQASQKPPRRPAAPGAKAAATGRKPRRGPA